MEPSRVFPALGFRACDMLLFLRPHVALCDVMYLPTLPEGIR